jgi:hypothetical protein
MASIKERVRKALPSWLILIRRYRKAHGVFPNLIRPATFNEKTLYRILFDRRLVLTRVADKAAVRSYVEARLGPQVLRTLYCLTIHPDTIPFDQLPDRFVVKPTHGCGWVQIVSDKSALNRGALIALCARWLNQSYYLEVVDEGGGRMDAVVPSGCLAKGKAPLKMMGLFGTYCSPLVSEMSIAGISLPRS